MTQQVSDATPGGLDQVIQIDTQKVREHLGGIVRGTVEQTLNALRDAQAEQLCQAQRYERSAP